MMSEEDSQQLIWATTNFGLLRRMSLKMQRNVIGAKVRKRM